MSKPLTVKELAAALPPGRTGKPRSPGFVYAMVSAGFPMPDKKATRESAVQWLYLNPNFTWSSVYAVSGTPLGGPKVNRPWQPHGTTTD